MDTATQAKIAELTELFCSTLKVECEKLYRSGMIDTDSYDKGQYALAKILLSASIKRLQDDFAPLHSKGMMKEVKNLVSA